MARSQTTKKITRIQREKIDTILNAALDVFSTHGFRGSTIDMIATASGISKPNILYYFDNKEAIHTRLLNQLLDTWLEPLESIDASGYPIDEICGYVERKLEMAQNFPRESRLFANEIIQGAPRILDELQGPLRTLVTEKANIIQHWADAGRIAKIDPYHLIFSIWATTQHYADFDVQVCAVLGDKNSSEHFSKAKEHLHMLFQKMLQP